VTIEDSYNFRRITEDLTTSGVVGSERLSQLSDAGYELIVNLLPDAHDQAVADEQQILESQGISYEHIPVDFKSPTLDDFDHFATVMNSAEGQRIHVHCAANWRVTAFLLLYAEAQSKLNATEIEAIMSTVWDPEADEVWSNFLRKVRQDRID
jgi:uncharacterized protein (TIGR01244 family)